MPRSATPAADRLGLDRDNGPIGDADGGDGLRQGRNDSALEDEVVFVRIRAGVTVEGMQPITEKLCTVLMRVDRHNLLVTFLTKHGDLDLRLMG